MNVTFKYEIGQLVFYNGHLYEVLARMYFETKVVKINKYNLRNVDGWDINRFVPDVWENNIKTLRRVK